MATIAKVALEIQAEKGGAYRVYPEAASQSFKRGEIVVWSSGKVAVGASDPSLNTVLGVALHDASGVTDTDVIVFVPSTDSLFVGNLAATDVTAVTDQGTLYGIAVASNKAHVDKGDTTNTRVVIVDLDSRDAVGDTAGRVIFKFLAEALAPAAGA